MKITCSGRKVNLKDSFVQRVEKRLEKLNKFFDENAEAHVTVVVERHFHKVEITVRDSGFVARAERTADQMEDAFDAAAEVLQKNIVKNRKKLSEKLHRPMPVEAFEEEVEEQAFHLIREKHFLVKPSTVDEAILQMNMLGHSFYLYLDVDTGEINAVYARNDGSYGVLIPER